MRPAFSDATIDCTEVANSLEQDWISPCVCTVWWDPAPSIYYFKILFSAVTWGWVDQYLFTQIGSNFHMCLLIQIHLNATERATPAYCTNQAETCTLPKTPPFRSNSWGRKCDSILREHGPNINPGDSVDTLGWRGDHLSPCELFTSTTLLFGNFFSPSFKSVALQHIEYLCKMCQKCTKPSNFCPIAEKCSLALSKTMQRGLSEQLETTAPYPANRMLLQWSLSSSHSLYEQQMRKHAQDWFPPTTTTMGFGEEGNEERLVLEYEVLILDIFSLGPGVWGLDTKLEEWLDVALLRHLKSDQRHSLTSWCRAPVKEGRRFLSVCWRCSNPLLWQHVPSPCRSGISRCKKSFSLSKAVSWL